MIMNDYFYEKSFYSNYYQQSMSAQKLIELTSGYQQHCKQEELTPVYTVNDVKLAIDDDCVDQDMINHFMTFAKANSDEINC